MCLVVAIYGNVARPTPYAEGPIDKIQEKQSK